MNSSNTAAVQPGSCDAQSAEKFKIRCRSILQLLQYKGSGCKHQEAPAGAGLHTWQVREAAAGDTTAARDERCTQAVATTI
jgi:hypothetical protein